MTKELSGVLTALATPLAEDGTIDDALLRLVVDRNLDAGVDGLVAGGGTGEFAWLSEGERLHLFDVVIEHTNRRVPVVAQTGAMTAAEAVRLSQAAEQAGADVLMLSLPYYEPLNLREVTRYIKTVAASVQLPIMLYNNPFTTGVNLDAATLAQFGREVDNIVYVKDSSKDWEQALSLIHRYSDDIGLIMGWDSYSFSALLEGATGVMAGAANVIPNEIMAVARAIKAGDVDTARQQWRRVYPVLDALLCVPFTQGVKAGLQLRGLPIGAPREPMLELAPEELQRLHAALTTLDA